MTPSGTTPSILHSDSSYSSLVVATSKVQISSIAASTNASPTNTTAGPQSSQMTASGTHTTSRGVIAGAVITTLLVIIFFIICMVWLYKRRERIRAASALTHFGTFYVAVLPA